MSKGKFPDPNQKSLDLHYLLSLAVERNINVDFSVQPEEDGLPFFNNSLKEYYYEQILERDALDLFVLLEYPILSTIDLQLSRTRLSCKCSLNILIYLNPEEKWCRQIVVHTLCCLSIPTFYNNYYISVLKEFAPRYDFCSLLLEHLIKNFGEKRIEFVKLILQLLEKVDLTTREKLAAKDATFFEKLFGEDV